MSEIATHRFVVEAGFLVRRQVINDITGAAWECGLECEHEKAGRSIRFTVSGDSGKLSRFLGAVQRWSDSL